VNKTHRGQMSSCSEPVNSRRESVTSDTGLSLGEGTAENAASSGPFAAPLDTILETVKLIYNSKTQIRKAHYEKIEESINEMKSKIIDYLLPLAKQPPKSNIINRTNRDPSQFFNTQTSYAEVVRRPAALKQKNVNVILKTGFKSEAVPKTIVSYEKSVAESLMKSNIKATIHATLPTRNGDIVMKFDKNDDIASISKHIGEQLNIKTQGRGLLHPKIKITHIPEYVTNDPNALTKVILESNEWLKDLSRDGNSLEVLFTYKVKNLYSAICKVSPAIRQRLLLEDQRIRVGMRSCPITDRIHLTKCGKCLKFGHKTANCRAESFTCSWCAGDHKTLECTEKENNSAHKCANCILQFDGERSVTHASHADDCSIYIKERERLINRTDWGSAPPPLE